MKLPAVLRKLKPLDVILDEGATLQARAEAIGAEIAELDQARAALLLDGEPEDIAAYDAKRARLAIELEQATARLARLDGERVDAEKAAEQDRQRKVYTEAKKRRAAGLQALADYDLHARAAAKALKLLVDVERVIAAANDSDQLPIGAEPIEAAEPDNSVPAQPGTYYPPQRVAPNVTKTDGLGRKYQTSIAYSHMTPGYTTHGAPGRPHQSILHRARIVGLKPGETLFGPPGI